MIKTFNTGADVTDYQRISVTMGMPDCGIKIDDDPKEAAGHEQ